MIERSDFGEVSKRRISINSMERSGKTSWGLMFMILKQGIMILLWGGG
jgi:hypothetical protein